MHFTSNNPWTMGLLCNVPGARNVNCGDQVQSQLRN